MPKEMLTDNGRQYTNWRGTTRFEKELKKDRIKHIKSQPHHPMTLGKIERFWQTVLGEYLQRAQFDSFEQARERIALWVKYYNFRRPHQGIGGLCPADRFFEVAHDLRQVIERGIQDNVLELALRGEPKKPFYMVGRMDNQSVVMQAEKGKLVMTVNNDKRYIDDEITPDNKLIYDFNGETNEQTTDLEEKEAQSLPSVQCGGESNGSVEFMERTQDNGRVGPGDGLKLHDASELAEPGTGGYVEDVRTEGERRRAVPETAPETGEVTGQKESQPVITTTASEQAERSAGGHPEEIDAQQLMQQLLLMLKQQSGGQVDDERERSESPDQGRCDHEGAARRDHSHGCSGGTGHIAQDLLSVAETSSGWSGRRPEGQTGRPPKEGRGSGDHQAQSREGTAQRGESSASDAPGDQGNPGGSIRRRPPEYPPEQRGQSRT